MEMMPQSTAVAPPVIPPPVPRKQRAPTLYAIIIFKILKGLLLLAAAGVVFSLIGVDLKLQFTRMLQEANLDPEGKLFTEVGQWLQTVTPGNIRIFATGTVLYSAFSLVEGTGLWLRASWAGWMAIGESAFFIPIEVYEMLERYSTTLAVVLLLNVVIVWYLYANRKRLFTH
jgi:uncharacterized membrane protein (DUF2068 family)